MMSDTHNLHQQIAVPEGDVLIHAGDATMNGTERELMPFLDWFGGQPHPHKLLVSGNHDWGFQTNRIPMFQACVARHINLLHDREVLIDGVNFWGTPWQPEFGGWAFNLPRGAALAEKWSLIPAHTEVLITHGPPMGIRDATSYGGRPETTHVGCEELAERLTSLPRLRVHVFGHIHEGSGITQVSPTLTFVNAAICNLAYRAVNPVRVVEIN